MTHEFRDIITAAQAATSQGLASVLATVVDLEGSSYRKPGVRMLILETNERIGAVSGGCVEKEVVLQAQDVFKTGVSKMMTYDGRYRLGCEGVLYILLELVTLTPSFLETFSKCLAQRKTFKLQSFYKKEVGTQPNIGSVLQVDNCFYPLGSLSQTNGTPLNFTQTMPPCFKLLILGAEHDAVQLCNYAALTGWDVTVVAGIKEAKHQSDFPNAKALLSITPEQLDTATIDEFTAVVLMTHNFAYDLRYLVALHKTLPSYIGVLGPKKRREDLLSQLLEYCPDVEDLFLNTIHGPAGLNIGSVTPQEIALSIVSEILAVTRNETPIALSEKKDTQHSKP